MNTPKQLADHLRQVHTGGNWTWSNLQEVLADVTWQEAAQEIEGFNSIGKLTFHIGYFITAVLNVMRGNPMEAHDKYSFDLPPIGSAEDWEALRAKSLREAEELATYIEKLPEAKLGETFVLEKYGTYHRNLLGLIEHTHYHLGQIAVMKKLVRR
jgi:uncharacterized damage-inducible protein DinB